MSDYRDDAKTDGGGGQFRAGNERSNQFNNPHLQSIFTIGDALRISHITQSRVKEATNYSLNIVTLMGDLHSKQSFLTRNFTFSNPYCTTTCTSYASGRTNFAERNWMKIRRAELHVREKKLRALETLKPKRREIHHIRKTFKDITTISKPGTRGYALVVASVFSRVALSEDARLNVLKIKQSDKEITNQVCGGGMTSEDDDDDDDDRPPRGVDVGWKNRASRAKIASAVDANLEDDRSGRRRRAV
ncbi:hypothetical protein Sjap_008994 [Stephania japonica]|uniref:Uncharacterized protein n=1 Tax=Stephania japonica TaxID=461633 RepID=A0AAP0PF61_9MAGN